MRDLSILGMGTTATVTSSVPERRESKPEREARKLEKERVNREKERERSLREEHVDGGYLVTIGVYTGIEDFSKPVVRQLMVSIYYRWPDLPLTVDRLNAGWLPFGGV